MTYFLTKKMKQQVKARQRKKKLAEELKPEIKKVDTEPPGSAKKRKRAICEDDIPMVPLIPSNVIVVPKGLTSQEAKKFRKDQRRRVRIEGRDDQLLRFVQSNGKNNTSQKLKKKFPRINDLVKEEESKKAQEAQKVAKQREEDALPQEYKDQYLAMDCEMVGIGTDGKISALARVSIVNWRGDIVLDTFVKVPGRVTDFRTWVSGVEPKHLKNKAAMDVKECRELVARLLKGKILVGHALSNDLHALAFTHPNMRDTGTYRPLQRLGGKKWRPRKLKDLVAEHLDMKIQQEGQAHDSVDDARAAMELFKCFRVAWERELEAKLKKKKKKKS